VRTSNKSNFIPKFLQNQRTVVSVNSTIGIKMASPPEDSGSDEIFRAFSRKASTLSNGGMEYPRKYLIK